MKIISEGDESDRGDESSVAESTNKGDAIGKKRNQVVARVRLVVFLVLLAVAGAVSFSVYYYTKSQESDAFENHFYDQASKVVQAFKFNAVRRLEALEAFSTQITSYGISSNSTFPFITLPDFERHATYTLQLAEVVALLTFPIITAETRSEWEAYSVANQGWLMEGLSLQQTSGGDDEAVDRLQGDFDKGNLVEEDAVDESQFQITPIIYKVKPGGTTGEYETGPGPYTVSPKRNKKSRRNHHFSYLVLLTSNLLRSQSGKWLLPFPFRSLSISTRFRILPVFGKPHQYCFTLPSLLLNLTYTFLQ